LSGRFEGERVVVVGAGVAGTAAAQVLVAEGAEVTVTERASERAVAASAGSLRALDVRLFTGGHEPGHLEGATLVVAGPGVPERAQSWGGPVPEGSPCGASWSSVRA
jgi:UDP-N-acetylmuramoylalanine-D-glutamate ligase